MKREKKRCEDVLLFVTFQVKRGLMDFKVNGEINFTVTACAFHISLCEIEISRDVHSCSNPFHYAQ